MKFTNGMLEGKLMTTTTVMMLMTTSVMIMMTMTMTTMMLMKMLMTTMTFGGIGEEEVVQDHDYDYDHGSVDGDDGDVGNEYDGFILHSLVIDINRIHHHHRRHHHRRRRRRHHHHHHHHHHHRRRRRRRHHQHNHGRAHARRGSVPWQFKWASEMSWTYQPSENLDLFVYALLYLCLPCHVVTCTWSLLGFLPFLSSVVCALLSKSVARVVRILAL